jgi:hypothetical protein
MMARRCSMSICLNSLIQRGHIGTVVMIHSQFIQLQMMIFIHSVFFGRRSRSVVEEVKSEKSSKKIRLFSKSKLDDDE